jgi:hypothetical protein
MSMMSRRGLLCGAPCALLAPANSRPVAAQGTRYRGGCCLYDLETISPQAPRGLVAAAPEEVRISRSSGDPTADRFLGLGLLRLATMFRIGPGFAFYDDYRAPNAFATPQTLLPDSRGTVLMGMRLFRRHMMSGDDGMTVIAICAHEFGHIHQMQSTYNAWLRQLDGSVKPVELHADFLTGYFLANRKEEHPDLDLQSVGATFDQMGDTDFNSPQHHGTSAERIAAITAGYRFGRSGRHDIDEAARAGLELLARIL